MKENLALLQKLYKAVSRERENGDIKSRIRDMDTMGVAISGASAALEKMKEITAGFDAREYFESGDFADETQVPVWPQQKSGQGHTDSG